VICLSRREFFSISLAPLIVRKAAACAVASLHGAGLMSPSPVARVSAQQATERAAWLGTSEGCSECRGLGLITCPACDGTGRWTKASESAGPLRRETARQAGRCAWCNEWGGVACPTCDGVGVVSSLDFDSPVHLIKAA
jgi:hypothetical protein